MNARTAVIATLLVAVVCGVGWFYYSKHSASPATPTATTAFDTEIPDGQTFIDPESSKAFTFETAVRLGDKTPGGFQAAIFEVLVKNKTDTPIKHLQVGGLLDPTTVDAIEAHVPFFGTASDEEYNLIPGQIPYGIYVSRTAFVRDPDQLAEPEKQALLTALRAPIHLKVKWQGGIEYIRIPANKIQYNF